MLHCRRTRPEPSLGFARGIGEKGHSKLLFSTKTLLRRSSPLRIWHYWQSHKTLCLPVRSCEVDLFYSSNDPQIPKVEDSFVTSSQLTPFKKFCVSGRFSLDTAVHTEVAVALVHVVD
jgi:hypothetical protein